MFLSHLSFGTSIISTLFKASINMFRRFLSRFEFDQISSTSTPRPEIIKWRTLEIGAIFRVLDRITIPTADGNKMYVVLETEQREIINVWVTSIINQEVMKYNLSAGNVFIKPLGKKTSIATGKEYFNFSVVLDVSNFM